MAETDLRPYMIRAVYEWCVDSGYTPYLAVKVNAATRVPLAYVKKGEIVLNLSHTATRNLTMNNELIQFSARFGGVSYEISVPVDAVTGIFARENGKGMFFEGAVEDSAASHAVHSSVPAARGNAAGGEPSPESPPPGKPRFTVVK